MNVGCFRKMAPTSKSNVIYNQQADATIYTVDPYGNITIPGKWDMGKYTKASHRQYFYHADTSTLIAAIDVCKNLPFGRDNAEGYEVVKKYYDLEIRYQGMQGTELKPVVEDPANRYMLWMGRIDGIDQYFLFGVKDCADCKGCMYTSLTLKTRKMSADAKVQFLKDIFLRQTMFLKEVH